MVNELSHFQKVIYCTISFLWHCQKDRSMVTIEQIGGWQSAEVGRGCHYKWAAEGDLEGQGALLYPGHGIQILHNSIQLLKFIELYPQRVNLTAS